MDLEAITNSINAHAEGIETRTKLVTGDLWADGEGWIGPTAGPGATGPTGQFVMDEIRKVFLTQNVLAEVLTRHTAGAIGQAPTVTTLPEEATDNDDGAATLAELIAVFDEEEDLIGGWLSENGVHEALQEAVEASLWASAGDDQPARAPLRVYIPASELDDAGELPVLPFAESLDRVFVHAPKPGTAGVMRDQDWQPLLGYHKYTEVVDDDEVLMLELSLLKSTWDTLGLELTGDTAAIQNADADATIVLQINVDDEQITNAVAYDLGGLLTITEITRSPLITEASISLQKLVSLSWTMLGRNTVVAGFLERLLLNAMPPGRWVDPNGNEVHPGTTGAKFQAEPFAAGPGTATFLSGIPQIDAEGNITGYSAPGVYDRQPVSPQTLIETKNEARAGILEECAQIHTLISGDATTSGKSREQALQDFSMSLDVTIPALRDAANEILSAAVRLAAFFASDGSQYAEAEVHIAPRKNLQVTDGEAAEEADEKAALAKDSIFAARVTAAINAAKEIKEKTGASVPWQILLVGNATNTAPAGFLQGAMTQVADSEPE